jgi:hypothetical protein
LVITEGGGFSPQYGVGTVADRAVGGHLSNKCTTNLDTSSSERTVQNREFIRSEYQIISNNKQS